MLRILCLMFVFSAGLVHAQDGREPPMSLDRLAAIVLAIDPDAEFGPVQIELTIADIPVLIVTDAGADRMRALVPIRSVEGMDRDELLRVMQANFDTALDARYAIAQGRLWATYIHPLSSLEREQLISGLVQTVNIAQTYGTLYSGGAAQFGHGDSGALHQELLEDLLNRGQEL